MNAVCFSGGRQVQDDHPGVVCDEKLLQAPLEWKVLSKMQACCFAVKVRVMVVEKNVQGILSSQE